MSKQEQEPSQSLFAGIEELVYQILFVPDVPSQQVRYEQIREFVFPVERKHHCLLVNAQNFAIRDCGCRPHTQSLSSQPTFSEKLSLIQYAQGCFLTVLGHDREANFAFLDVKHCVSSVPLREDCLLLGKSHDFPTLADRGKEFPWVEVVRFPGWHS
jgi:hypothetical protein